jgi:2'-5' RNA ligase
MRLFIAINLTEEIKDFLTAAIGELKEQASGGNFTHRENLHLTLVFLGEVGGDRLPSIKSAMDRVHGGPFCLSFSGFGRFERRGGDIHWAGVEKNETLFSIQQQLEEELRKEGFSLENREYSPHLTLGREVRLADWTGGVFKTTQNGKHEMAAARISLMKSERINGKLVYSEIFGKDLT